MSMFGPAALAVVAPFAMALAGCFVLTGSTDGYQRAPSDGGMSDADGAATGLELGCLSAADCPNEGGAEICCLTPTSLTSASTSCQAAPCSGSFAAQLCKTAVECPDAACLSQVCPFSGTSVTIQACGALATCTPH